MTAEISTLFIFNPNLYGGGGEICPLQAVFLPQLKSGWRQIAETLWLLLLAYYTSFGILYGRSPGT